MIDRMRKKLRLGAVLDADFDKFLEGLGILGDLESGALKCGICGQPLTKERVYCVYPSQGQIKLCCNDPKCYLEVVREKTEETSAYGARRASC